ncbi:hypothetical protein GCM10025859_07500 [Alicyclobacillus fastidiosus]|nr:hypothetical protein GCM10025859_07500 [Alicyclobacillus fastidiosus]
MRGFFHPEYATKETFKTWTAFIEQIGQRLWKDLYSNDINKFKEKIYGNHLLVAQLYQEEFGTQAFYNELLQAIPYDKYQPSHAHWELLSLGWRDIITTNQDDLIERALNDLYISHDVILDDLDIPTKGNPLKVHKIHGSMERPSSIVFTEEHYRTYEHSHPLMFVKLKSMFAENTIVFVGYSLTDPDFKIIHGWVSDVLSPKFQRKAYAFVFADEIDRYTARYWEQRNIILLPIPVQNNLNRKQTFLSGIREYIEILKPSRHDNEGDTSDTDYKTLGQYNSFTQKYKDLKALDVKAMINDMQVLPNDGSSSAVMRIFFWKIIDVLKNLSDDEYKFGIFVQWLKFVNPFTSVGQHTLIDYLITQLKLHPEWGNQRVLEEFYQLKAESLCRIGKYADANSLCQEIMATESDLSLDLQNNLLFIRLIAAKFEFDLHQVRELVGRIVLESEDPIWLNRIGNALLILGDDVLASVYFNRAIKAAQDTRDNWNQFVAYNSLLLIRDSTYTRLHSVKMRNVHESLVEVKNSFTKTPDPRYKRLKEFEQLKTRWNEYHVWEMDVKSEHRAAFNSESTNLYFDLWDYIYFVQAMGLPDAYLQGSTYDKVGAMLFENNPVIGVKFAVYFGHTDTLSKRLSFSRISELSTDSRDELSKLSNEIYSSLLKWIERPGELKYFGCIGVWFDALAKLWSFLIPVSFDEEIKGIEDFSWRLFESLTNGRLLMQFHQVAEQIIHVLGAYSG